MVYFDKEEVLEAFRHETQDILLQKRISWFIDTVGWTTNQTAGHLKNVFASVLLIILDTIEKSMSEIFVSYHDGEICYTA